MNGSPHTLKMPQFIKKIHKMNKHYLNLFSKYFFYIQKYLVTAFAVFQKYTTPRSSTPSGAGGEGTDPFHTPSTLWVVV